MQGVNFTTKITNNKTNKIMFIYNGFCFFGGTLNMQ